MATKKTHAFRATFERPADLKSGGYVRVPFDVEAAFGKKRAPVLVTIGAATYRSTVAVYGGDSYVVVREEMRKKAAVAVGDAVDVTLAADDAPRTVALEPDMKKALAKSKAAQRAWDALSFTHKREHSEWIAGAKKAETRSARVAKWIDMLTAPKKKAKAKAKAKRKA